MTTRDLVHGLILRSASRRPDSPAVTYKDATYSYGRLAEETVAAAKGLVELGLRKSDRVGVFLEKRVETVIAQFGAAAAGGVFVPINPLLRARQAAHILRNCQVRILVTSSVRPAGLRDVLRECPDLKHVVVVDDDGGFDDLAQKFGFTTWIALISAGSEGAAMPHRVVDGDVAAILFTSGSTGMPKGVTLSHRNLTASARSASEHLRNNSEDRILCVLPFSFDYGLVQLTSVFTMGASVVLFDYLFPQDVPKIIASENVTGLAGVPPLWIQLGRIDWPQAAIKCLRYITNSGGAMPKATLHKLRSKMPNVEIHLMYGMTEAFRSTCLPPSQIELRPNSIGKPIPNAEVVIVRKDQSLCEARETGELVHRGVFVTQGYWNDSEATAERFRPAPDLPAEIAVTETAVWSGDLAWYDEEGFFYFVGRMDDQIKTSGYRVSPFEVEEVVYETNFVAEAVAFGVPHPELGHAIVVVATPPRNGKLDTETILQKCRQDMPSYMVPMLIIERATIPRSPSGKFDRRCLANEFADKFETSK